uniref:C2H2-type domain-containing protein n=1 Tax=Anser brachyrhynchus TaxID=132585 RepID=A0A8B9CYM5_9AVES
KPYLSRMDVKVDWGSESNTCDTGEKQSNYSRKITEEAGHKPNLQEEVDMNYSETSSPCCNSAGLPGKQELPTELQSEDKETYETCYQKRGESTAGIFVPSSTNFDLQCEDKDAERCSSERSKKPRRRARGDNENAILGGVFDEDPYACPTCGKGFDKPNLLSKHKVIHRQEKPYKCQECGMAFVQLLRLKRHQQTHSGERPFYCEECGGTFTRLASLQRHQRIHTGEKPYSCDYCGHSFTESGTLRREQLKCTVVSGKSLLDPLQRNFHKLLQRLQEIPCNLI